MTFSEQIMKLSIYQVDAFAHTVFTGNPAAVCPLTEWLPDALMQQIAAENNLAETAFFVPDAQGYQIRWFTPTVEVDLCGHATIAAAYVVFQILGFSGDTIPFYSPRSGPLPVTREGNLLALNFPADTLKPVDCPEALAQAIGMQPLATFKGKTDYLLTYATEAQIREMAPDMRALAAIQARGVIVTAPGETVDFVSRFFAPQCGVDEDPVTGSAHTSLIPYWAQRLGKRDLTAFQASKRGGYLSCTCLNNRVMIRGEAVLYLSGEIFC
jgi:PhzF family phenazine biosynthesis protein